MNRRSGTAAHPSSGRMFSREYGSAALQSMFRDMFRYEEDQLGRTLKDDN
jgi:hypothetical protein